MNFFQGSTLYVVSGFHKEKLRNKPDYRHTILTVPAFSERLRQQSTTSHPSLSLFSSDSPHSRNLQQTLFLKDDKGCDLTALDRQRLDSSGVELDNNLHRSLKIPRNTLVQDLIMIVKIVQMNFNGKEE